MQAVSFWIPDERAVPKDFCNDWFPFPCVRVDWRYSGAMLIGYARVSTDNQETAAQVAALKSAGCERIYREKASGGRWDRPELQDILARVRKGDVLVVWK